MADDVVPGLTTTAQSPPKAQSQVQGLFSRRPSFFGGGRNKTPKHAAAAASSSASASASAQTHTHTRTATPPQINLPVPLLPSQFDSPPKNPSTPPRRKHASRHSISSSVAELGSSLRRSRSASLRTEGSSATNGSSQRSSHRRTPSATVAISPEPVASTVTSQSSSNVNINSSNSSSAANVSVSTAPSSRPTLSISTFTRNKQSKSADNVPTARLDKSPLTSIDTSSTNSTTVANSSKFPFASMAGAPITVPLRHPPSQKEIQHAQLQRQQSFGATMNINSGGLGGLGPAAPIVGFPTTAGGANPHIIFQHIHEMASKRISTLDYLRKAHEGRIYWFNTLLFSKNDLTRLPSFTPRYLSRRATNYLLLGFSLPTILDLNATSASDYLKALNALLLEFEQYQQMHPPDGSAPSSLSRARIPQMFKRPSNLMGGIGGKGRRSSSAASDFPLTLSSQSSFNSNNTNNNNNDSTNSSFSSFQTADSSNSPSSSSHLTNEDLLLPNESYTYLQTPSLPFDPDFFSTFATLCDVLIDCYTKILSLLASPESLSLASGGAPSSVGEMFTKADARVRKIILAGTVREFEESCRGGVRGEVGGVGRVVLGGLL